MNRTLAATLDAHMTTIRNMMPGTNGAVISQVVGGALQAVGVAMCATDSKEAVAALERAAACLLVAAEKEVS